MLNGGAAVADDVLKVLEGVELHGSVNVDDDRLLANVQAAIRLSYPQVQPHQPNYDRVVLLGGGPSLNSHVEEIRDLVFAGAKLVTTNGAYQWAIDRNLQPKTQIVMDARPSNVRFVQPAVPRCKYLLATQCAPETWAAVAGRPDVWAWHAAVGQDGPLKTLLDAHYAGQWFGIGGGTTVVSRAVGLLRTLGYLRFDLFGVDSCFLDGQHHAFEQTENAKDKPYRVRVGPSDRPDLAKTFTCAPWHLKQLEDFLQMIRINGDQFLLNIHGDGLLAYMLQSSAACALAIDDVTT